MYIGNKRVLGVFQTIYEDTPTHEASLDVSKNGEYEVTPDEKMALSKVKVNVNVPVVLEDKEITENGTYTASEGFDGIGQVIVNAKLPEQEKTIEITENGVTEILPDDGYTLSKVTANVNVSSSGENKLAQFVDKSITKVTAEDLQGITKIGEYAFYRYKALETIDIRNNITAIGEYAFYECTALKRIILPSSITRLITYAFFGCSGIQEFIIEGENLRRIDSYCLYLLVSLTKLTLPSSITYLESGLYIGSSDNKATIIFLGTTPPTIASNTFSAERLEKIIVPKGCGDIYKSKTNWSKFADYIEETAE
jgi:hypothetical protein